MAQKLFLLKGVIKCWGEGKSCIHRDVAGTTEVNCQFDGPFGSSVYTQA